jgi:hypothetical protein
MLPAQFPFCTKFVHIIWTRPIQHIPSSTPWKIEVGVLTLGGLPLLHFLATSIIEETPMEFLDTKRTPPSYSNPTNMKISETQNLRPWHSKISPLLNYHILSCMRTLHE